MVRAGLLSFFFLGVILGISAQEEKATVRPANALVIAWEGVESAVSYRLELRKDKLLILEKDTEKNETLVNLRPGIYEYRILVIDSFGRSHLPSSWQALEVKRKVLPTFRLPHPLTIREGEGLVDLLILPSHPIGETEFTLSMDDFTVPTELIQNGGKYTLRFNLKGIQSGVWALEARQALGKTVVFPQALTVFSPPLIEITSIEPRSVPAKNSLPFTIKGQHFEQGMRLSLQNIETLIHPVFLQVNNANEAIFWLNLDKAKEGDYRIFIQTLSGEERIVDGVFLQILPFSEKKRLDKKPPRWEFFLSQFPSPILGFSPKKSRSSSTALSAAYLVNIDAGFSLNPGGSAPFFSDLGAELRFSGGFLSLFIPFYELKKTGVFSIDLSAYWQPWRKGSVDPVILLGIGNRLATFPLGNGFDPQNVLYIHTGIALNARRGQKVYRYGLHCDIEFFPNGTREFMVGLILQRRWRLE